MRSALARLLVRFADARRMTGVAGAGARSLALAERIAPEEAALVRALAERDRAAGKAAEGERRLRDALAKRPESAALRRALGAYLAQTGKAGEAVEILRGVVSTGADAEIDLELAIALAAAGQFTDAEARLGSVLQARPGDRDARAFRGYLLHRSKRAAESAAEFERAFAGGTPGDQAYAWRAICYKEAGDAAAAAEMLRSGIAAHPRSTRLLGDYARFLAEQGGAQEAEELLRRSLAIAPADPLALATLGSLLSRGESNEGEVFYRYALSIDPAHESALAGLFKILDRDRRELESLVFARRAIAHPAAGGRVLCLCAQRLAEAGERDEAKRAFLLASERDRNDPAVALALGELVAATGGAAKEADSWFSKALAAGGGDAKILARVAGARLAAGREGEAEDLATRALAIDPKSAEALSVRAGILTSRGKIDEALAVRKQTLQIHPDSAAAHIDAADLYARLERFEDAQMELQIASRLNPTGRLLLDYATVLLSQNRAAFGAAALADLVKEGRGGARARFVYAHLLASLEKGDEARSHLAAALEASERAKLDHPLLREARARFIAPVDAGFVKLAGG